MDPYLVPCLVELRQEFNDQNPSRDKGADGWIGDAAHQKEKSDHNPDSQGRVLAIDIDSSGPWPIDFDEYVQDIVKRCQSGDEYRLEYIIRNRKIYERSNGYAARNYTGSDPHTNHAHFSARHDHTGQNDKSEWMVTMLSQADKDFITSTVRAEVAKVAGQVWGYELERPDSTSTPKATTSAGSYQRYTDVVTAQAADRVIAAVTGSKGVKK